MKIALDSNVLIASFATEGVCHALFEHCINNEYEIFLSELVTSEVKEKLQVKLKFPNILISEIEIFLREHSKVIKPPKIANQICRDLDDDNILSLGKTGGVDYIVTGDKDLLDLTIYESIPIVNPKEFTLLLQNLKKQ